LTAIHLIKELKNSTSKESTFPMKKWAHELKREFSKEEVQIANEYMKKCSLPWLQKRQKSKQ
jgi:hypothetical protein